MTLSERLRRLDEAVVGPPPSIAQRAPTWARLATAGMGMWFLLLIYVAEYRTVGWVIAAIVYGAVEVPAFVAAARWHYRHGTLTTRGRLAAFAAFPLVIGAAIIVAVALGPAPWARSQIHYPRGCHPASTDVVNRISRSIHGDWRIEWAVVVASKDAAVATALVSGTLDIGVLKVPLHRQPADYALAPGPLASNNDLARQVSPSLPRMIGGGPSGSPFDQLNNDRVAAEACAASG